jgi:multidrug transporter EmrE-like cation transporter
MPSWAISGLIAAVLIAAHYLTLRAATGRVSDALGAVLVEAAATAGLLALLLARGVAPGSTTAPGVAWACASGLCISGAMALLFHSLRSGGPVSATGPIVLGGGVTLAALAAPLFFQEGFTLRRGVGVALGFTAIVLLATERR